MKRAIQRCWSRVRSNERVAEGTYWLELAAPQIASIAAPGQFVMIGFGGRGWGAPFLPRPNSVAWVGEETIGLLIRRYGEGSRRLSALRPGDETLLLGPLGNHFELGDARLALCIAGGVGLAPFLFLRDWADRAGYRSEVRLLYGERTEASVFDPEKLVELSGLEPEICTEDGSRGREGRVTDVLDLESVELILSCGPTAMLREVRGAALSAHIPCQLAVEEHMGCGVGTCIGCAIETVDPETKAEGYSLVCMEGPVFAAERLRW